MKEEFERERDGSVWRLVTIEQINLLLHEQEPLFHHEGVLLSGIRCRLLPNLGLGRVEIIRVRESLYISRVDAILAQDYRGVGDPRMAKVRILLAGELQVEGSDLRIEGAGAYLEVDPGEQYHSWTLKGGFQTRFVVVNCNPGFFSDVASISPAALPEPFVGLFQGTSDQPDARYTPLGPDLLRAANDIMRAEESYSPELRNAFFSVKCQEIACAVVRDLAKNDAGAQQRSLSLRDINRVHEARDILEDAFARPPTIAELSRTVGLNRTKLKGAFKSVFGMTMADFTMKCRMERATELISGTDMTIAEVAYALGYDHPTNFSATFRAYHGLSPRDVRRANSLP